MFSFRDHSCIDNTQYSRICKNWICHSGQPPIYSCQYLLFLSMLSSNSWWISTRYRSQIKVLIKHLLLYHKGHGTEDCQSEVLSMVYWPLIWGWSILQLFVPPMHIHQIWVINYVHWAGLLTCYSIGQAPFKKC